MVALGVAEGVTEGEGVGEGGTQEVDPAGDVQPSAQFAQDEEPLDESPLGTAYVLAGQGEQLPWPALG
jgi:hypothetical protein